MTLSTNLDLAGMTSVNGALDARGFGITGWSPLREVRTDNGYLLWGHFTEEHLVVNEDGEEISTGRFDWGMYDSSTAVRPDAELLTRFVRLRNGSDEAIRAFAQQWGILCVCEHLDAPGTWKVHGGRLVTCWPPCHSMGQSRDGYLFEKTETWRRLAQYFHDIIEVAAWVRAVENGTLQFKDAPRQTIERLHCPGAYQSSKPDEALSRIFTDHDIRWAWMGILGPILEGIMEATRPAIVFRLYDQGQLWGDEPTPRLAIETGDIVFGLLGALALQLTGLCIGSRGAYICSGCGEMFPTEKRRKASTRHYCKTCHDAKVPQRDASRDYRRRDLNRGARHAVN